MKSKSNSKSSDESFIVAENGAHSAAIVIGQDAPPFYYWLAGELQRYVIRLSGAELPVITADKADSFEGTLITLGDPEANPLAAEAQNSGLTTFDNLKTDGYLIQTGKLNGHSVIIAGGLDERSSMYAVYELLEQLGVAFQLTGDIIREVKPILKFPYTSLRQEPALRKRGLHIRHFVMPWMGMDYFRQLIDQMAKLKYNYLEFFAYVGSPWLEYDYKGEKKLLGDLYNLESGFTAWRPETGSFSTDDVIIGKEHFHEKRPCAPEFQHCRTPEDAYLTAKHLLKEFIAYAHSRHIEVWFGKGDCPSVPVNLARHAYSVKWNAFFGLPMISPEDSAGIDIWSSMLDAMVRDYPEADGYWLWLAEVYFRSDNEGARKVIEQYEPHRHLIPGVEELRSMGYDQYLTNMDDQTLFESDVTSLHYAKRLMEYANERHPDARWGVSVLGRSYLLPALDALLPSGVALQSMEAAPCWNHGSRVPMENFGKVKGRDLFVVPRLDDDESEFAMQFNVGLYDNDRVISGSVEFGLAGAIPQTGKTRGLEQNARFIADGGWNSTLTPDEFYGHYVARIFGKKACQPVLSAYRILEENELFLSLQVGAEYGWCFQGIGNFVNYADSRDLGWIKRFRVQSLPLEGPDFPDWNVKKEGSAPFIQRLRLRENRFGESIAKLKKAEALLASARELVLPGAWHELEYLIYKTECYRLHLNTLRALMQGFICYDSAFRNKQAGCKDCMLARFEECEYWFDQSCARVSQTAERIASLIDDPTEKHILFRYNVRFVKPFREFRKFVANVANFHRGMPYWERVNWDVICND